MNLQIINDCCNQHWITECRNLPCITEWGEPTLVDAISQDVALSLPPNDLALETILTLSGSEILGKRCLLDPLKMF